VAVPIWKGFMTRTLEGVAVPAFAVPGNDEVFGKQVPVPSVVGLDVTAATAALDQAGFTVRVGPAVPSAVAAGLVATQTPSGVATQGSLVTIAPSSGPDPAAATPAPPAGPGATGPPAGQGGPGRGP
jgi:beta-lactam-binding protein with PASTA domain